MTGWENFLWLVGGSLLLGLGAVPLSVYLIGKMWTYGVLQARRRFSQLYPGSDAAPETDPSSEPEKPTKLPG
jgi:hypothetical protein